MAIPALCLRGDGLQQGEAVHLERMLDALGFEACWLTCDSVADSKTAPPYSKPEIPRPIPHPVCVPVIGRGDRLRSGRYRASPRVESLDTLCTPNEKLVVILADRDVADEELEPAQSAGLQVLRYAHGEIESVDAELTGLLRSFEQTLLGEPKRYQHPDHLRDALTYEAAEKRVYVYADRLGVIKLRYDILAADAAPALRGGYYRFQHWFAPRGPEIVKLEGDLKDLAAIGLTDFASKTSERFAVLRFGPRAQEITWREVPATLEVGRSIEILVPSDGIAPQDLISYGYIWSHPSLFTPEGDVSAFRALHHFRKLMLSIRFVRQLAGIPWRFAVGPMLERYGPYNNALGAVDAANTPEEHTGYFEFAWRPLGVARGSWFNASWKAGKAEAASE